MKSGRWAEARVVMDGSSDHGKEYGKLIKICIKGIGEVTYR